jgi:hypothetical protein
LDRRPEVAKNVRGRVRLRPNRGFPRDLVEQLHPTNSRLIILREPNRSVAFLSYDANAAQIVSDTNDCLMGGRRPRRGDAGRPGSDGALTLPEASPYLRRASRINWL